MTSLPFWAFSSYHSRQGPFSVFFSLPPTLCQYVVLVYLFFLCPMTSLPFWAFSFLPYCRGYWFPFQPFSNFYPHSVSMCFLSIFSFVQFRGRSSTLRFLFSVLFRSSHLFRHPPLSFPRRSPIRSSPSLLVLAPLPFIILFFSPSPSPV